MSQIFNTVGVTSITDVIDASKALGINLGSAASDTTLTLSVSQSANRTLTIPDATTTMVGTDTTQIITNKTTYEPLNLGLTATGTTQLTALVLTAMHNVITTVTLTNYGVQLPVPLGPGLRCIIANQGANPLSVYPAIGGTIDQAAVNAPVFIPTGATAVYGSENSSSVWYTINPVITLGAGTTVTYGNGEASISVGNAGNLPPSNGGTGVTATPTNGQLLIGNGTGYTLSTLTAGTAISITNGVGSITVTNTGVTSLTSGTGISVSASTGAITVTNTGVTSWSGGTTGLSSATSTGAVIMTGTLVAVNGGTGQSAYTVGDLLFANTSTTLARLNDVPTGNVLISGGSGVAPLWGKVNLATSVTGSLPAVNGGTGISGTPTNGQLLIGNGTGFTLATITAGTAISVTNASGAITVTNTGVTSWSGGTTGLSSPTSTGSVTITGTLIAANGGTGQSVYTVGDLLFANTTTTLSRLSDVPTGNVLISGGSGVAPLWGKVNLATSVTGFLPAANGGTGVTATPTNGQLLIGNGSGFTLATLTAGTAISVTNASGAITVTNTGVTNVTGTANQVAVSASTGSVTLSTPSTFIAPGTIQDTTGMLYSTNAAVSAAGTTQGTATALTKSYSVVTTAASNSGVVLPTPGAGGLISVIVNKGANAVKIYPASGGTIDGAAANAAITLAVGGTITLEASSTTQWYSTNPPMVAGTGISVSFGNGGTTIATTGTSSTITYAISNDQLTVDSASTSTAYYTLWDNTRMSGFTNRKIAMWVVPGSGARNLTVSLLDNGGSSLGSTTVNGGSATGYYSFTFTAPSGDTRLDIQVSRTGGSGSNPNIYCINMDLS